MRERIANVYSAEPSNWAKDFLRNPEDFPERVDPNYLANQRSAASAFLEWFLEADRTSYENMLRTTHRIAACGPHGGSYYKIPTPCGKFLVPHSDSSDRHIKYESPVPGWVRDTYPGAMRSDLEAMHILHPTEDIVAIADEDLNLMIKAKACVVRPSISHSINSNSWSGQRGPKRFHVRFSKCSVQLSVTKLSRCLFTRCAPVGNERDKLLRSCSETMEHCRSLVSCGETRTLSQGLLCYYHLAVNLMPFANINNSLFMGQINAILRLVGLSSLPHSSLDSLALILPCESFVRAATMKHPSLISAGKGCGSS
jgi:hypothetical protein